MKKLNLFNLLVIIIFFISCSKQEIQKSEITEKSLDLQVLEAYQEGMKSLEEGDVLYAAKKFNEAELLFPQSSWAPKSALMASYAYYLQNQYDQAISTAQRFISLHPGNKHAVYAYYLIGQSYYERIQDVARDQRITELALESFIEVVRRYPGTDYAKDSQLKIDLTLDHLAGKEMYIGRYYLQKKAFLAAINRFRTVTVDYQTTSHVPEALHRTVEAYLSMGLLEEAYNTASVLGHNFPDSSWYKDSYELIRDNVE